MSLPILPIVRPTFPPLESIADRFSAALKSGVVTNNGPYVEQFEAALTEYLGVPTICFSSGMAALVTMLMVEGVAGYEVICPSFTFCATPHAVRLAGGKVVFADIDPDTLTLDPADVGRKITLRTKAILGVDVYGICCNYDALQSVASRRHVDLLLDRAPAFGSQIYGNPTAGHGDCQIFSFHATKPFAIGEGGALCSESNLFISEARKIRNFGQCSPPETLWPTIGFNGKMQEISALIGLEQLNGFNKIVQHRNYMAQRLCLGLNVDGVSWTLNTPGQLQNFCYYPILIDEAKFGMSRDAVMAALERRGIMSRKYYPAMHLDECYTAERTSLPVTERVASQVIALPIYNSMEMHECERIYDSIREIQQCGS